MEPLWFKIGVSAMLTCLVVITVGWWACVMYDFWWAR